MASETWRLIDNGACEASYNMALDEALAEFVRRRESPPTLRLYSWQTPSVSLGCHQKASDIDISYCLSNNIPVVRRPTGGRAILHGRELTYSFSVDTETGKFSKGLLESYHIIGVALKDAFKKMGIQVESRDKREKGSVLTGSPLCFKSSSYGEILIGGIKAVGSAQRRWPDGILQQGSIPYEYDYGSMRSIFRLKDNLGVIDQMKGLLSVLPDLDEGRLKEAIVSSFEETFSVSLEASGLSQDEVSLALALQAKKYHQDCWTLGR